MQDCWNCQLFDLTKVFNLNPKFPLPWILLLACISQTTFAEEPTYDMSEQSAQTVNSAEELTFDVFEFQVDGNSVLKSDAIEQAIYPYMGEKKTIEDVEQARSALEKTYQEAGYLTVSVSIPQQEVNQGIVRLQVTEGKVERLQIVDSQYHTPSEIKSRAAQFAEGSVPHFPTAQKELGTLNRNQNRQVTDRKSVV